MFCFLKLLEYQHKVNTFVEQPTNNLFLANLNKIAKKTNS